MGWLTTLSSFAELFKRLLARWDRYDQERKQLRREERRAAVADDPARAFADLFGQPDGTPPPTLRPLCDPTPPRLQWSQSSDGGACLSGEALGELVNYIHDLRECATAPR